MAYIIAVNVSYTPPDIIYSCANCSTSQRSLPILAVLASVRLEASLAVLVMWLCQCAKQVRCYFSETYSEDKEIVAKAQMCSLKARPNHCNGSLGRSW